MWIVKYVSGSERIKLNPNRKHFAGRLRRGDKIKVQVSNHGIVVQRGKKALLSIPDTEVTEITHAHRSHRVSESVLAGTNDMCAGEGCILVAPIGLAAAVATLPFTTTRHFVQILWQENGAMHTIEVRLSKRDYQGFLDVLQNVTNKPPKPRRPWRGFAVG